MAPPTAAAFIAYFVVIAGIGYASLRRTHGLDDYAVGGRSLKAPVAALSAGASDMSGWLLLGLPGAVYALGLSQSWIVIGLVAGAWCNWKWVAPRLRHASAALDGARSLPQLFTRRMGGDRRAVTVVATLVVLGSPRSTRLRASWLEPSSSPPRSVSTTRRPFGSASRPSCCTRRWAAFSLCPGPTSSRRS